MTGIHSEAPTSRPDRAAPRAKAYGLLAAAFRYPDDELFSSFASGAEQRGLFAAVEALPYSLSLGVASLPIPSNLEAAQVEYTRLFDIGTYGPPCPLSEGHHRVDRLQVMEEVMRFFDYFGLRFQPDAGLFPDHLSVELEFMKVMAGAEASADQESTMRAQHDFLERHLCTWLPQLQEAVSRHAEMPLYPALTDIALRFVEGDRGYLAGKLRRVWSEERQ